MRRSFLACVPAIYENQYTITLLSQELVLIYDLIVLEEVNVGNVHVTLCVCNSPSSEVQS